MSTTEKHRLAGGWWTVEPDDPVWLKLSPATQQLLASKDYPDLHDLPVVEDLLLIGAACELDAYINTWLANRLSEATGETHTVEGDEPRLLPCPCCGFLTLPVRGEYMICDVCFWEDDGTEDPGDHSHPNHASLIDYRRQAKVETTVLQEGADPRFGGGALSDFFKS